MVEYTVKCELFSRNFSLIPAKISFKYKGVKSFLIVNKKCSAKKPQQNRTYLYHNYFNSCHKLYARHLLSEETANKT